MATVDKRFVTSLGPVKLEIMDLSSTANDETVSSFLVNPLFALAANQGDAGGANIISASVSGKTITIRDPSVTNVILLVFGF